MAAAKALELHARLVARDERALAEFVEIAAPWLLGVSEAILRDADDAEEVVQEAIAIVWNRIGTVAEDPRGLMAWALRVVRNRAIDSLRSRKRWFRKARRIFEVGLDVDAVAAVRDIDEAGTPGWHVHRSVHAALETLPVDQRLAVQLAFFHGLTHSEIARQLDIPIGTVKTRLRLAFEKLRHALAPMKDWIL
ncbi:MAG TPA: sigma-70 family RNA polymerase sigma factor [Gemmatimonadales bacterium]|nr:sigma-70 family RNA polymerase sigma factor [Gemmatimonadales bacterium]